MTGVAGGNDSVNAGAEVAGVGDHRRAGDRRRRRRCTGTRAGRPARAASTPRRRPPRGSRRRSRATCSLFACASGVSVGPGQMALMRIPCLRNGIASPADVRADRLLAPHVVGLVVLLRPLRRGIEVGDVEVLVAGAARFDSQPRPAAEEMKPMAAPCGEHAAGEHPVDQVPVPDEVDASRCPGVPSATPAHENSASHRAAALVDGGVDRRLVGEVHVDRLRARAA